MFEEEDKRIEDLGENERHLHGRLYKYATEEAFYPDRILNRDQFFFEPARSISFAVNDCLIHAINYLFYYPLFVTREQVHQLALWRKKKDPSFIVDQKVSNGYSVSLFSNLVYIRGNRYAILNLMSFTADNSMPVWSQLE
jgi:hypothetical protein